MKQGIKSIQELYQHLEEQRENRKDIIADTRSLVVNSADGISTLSVSTGDDILTYPISDISHRQIAESSWAIPKQLPRLTYTPP